VAGAGGYWHLHQVAKQYLDDRHGLLRLKVTRDRITGKYYGVPRPQESWSGGARLIDSFQFNWKPHRLV